MAGQRGNCGTRRPSVHRRQRVPGRAHLADAFGRRRKKQLLFHADCGKMHKTSNYHVDHF